MILRSMWLQEPRFKFLLRHLRIPLVLRIEVNGKCYEIVDDGSRCSEVE